jgi:hypothetical protein
MQDIKMVFYTDPKVVREMNEILSDEKTKSAYEKGRLHGQLIGVFLGAALAVGFMAVGAALFALLVA